MKLCYENKMIDLIECKSFYSRFMGFMFQKKIDRALLFDKCNSVHTFFMKEKIDIVMCNKENVVLFYYPNVNRGKIVLPKKGVTKVFETPSSYFNIEKGKKMIIK